MREYFNEEEITEREAKRPAEREFANELREKLRDPHFLPTREQILRAFPVWEYDSGDYDVMHVCKDINNPIFEFFNEEHLNALSDYFVTKISEYGGSKEKPIIILEIGAGNGRLSYFLQKMLEGKVPGQVKVIASDSGEWKLKNDFPVEQLKHDEAMSKYNPDIVVFSWMPYGEDYTKEMRKCPSVKEYILIGEDGGGNCGSDETWGYVESRPNDLPLYEKDGFEKEYLDSTELNICRTDYPGSMGHSRTVSFRRKK